MSGQQNSSDVSAIHLPDDANIEFQLPVSDAPSFNAIEYLGKTNIFIGSNNAGKSRLMRTLANSQPQRFSYKALSGDLEQRLQGMQEDFMKLIRNPPLTSGAVRVGSAGVNVDLTSLDFTKFYQRFLEPGITPYHSLQNTINTLLRTDLRINARNLSLGGADDDRMRDSLHRLFDSHATDLEIINALPLHIKEKKTCYIPAFRTLEHFFESNEDFIERRVRQNYKLKESMHIFTGQKMYATVRSMLLGERQERDKIRAYEKFLQEKLFDGKDIVLIPKENSDVLTVRIGDDEKPIFNLGDGIQSLIILTFPIFIYDEVLLFIEEPETNLHPGMQRKFLEVLQNHPQHQYFITTHSNHFLDLTIEYKNISVYLCRKADNVCHVEVVAYGDRSILEELGAQNTSVFLSNKTIWVEGVTDRLYIAKFLELYIKNQGTRTLVEDQDYSFVEYGGNNITHWSFLDKVANDSATSSVAKINAKRLCGQMVLIADGDGSGTKQSRKEALRAELGERFIDLTVREVENLLAPLVIARAIRSYEKSDEETYIDVFAKVQQDDYTNQYLGEFIENRFREAGISSRRKKYADESGTIIDKVAFCKKACRYMKAFSDLSPQAQHLTKQIYDFIAS